MVFLVTDSFQVACKVRARYSSGKDWTMTTRSKDFFAGIKVKFQKFMATSLSPRQSAALFMLFVMIKALRIS